MATKPIRLLLVEDNPADACLFLEVITDTPGVAFSIRQTDRLEPALARLGEEGFDVILLDLRLPDATGLETFVQTYAEAPDIPIIVLTGTDDDTLALRCVKGGAQDYLVKGEITAQILVRTIRHAIERHRLLLELEKTAALLARKSEALNQTLRRVEETAMKRSLVSLETCADRALAALARPIAEAGARITRDPLPEVQGDPNLLVQLYQHLIGNAVKFVRGVRPEIHLTAERDGNQWHLGVKDNGIGIARRFRDRVFLPFQRLNGRQAFAGTGIGLAICRRIVERHGGRIWVDSKPGGGSHFRFAILDTAERALTGTAAPAPGAAKQERASNP
jgi:signal transduction histidine kinase